MDRKLSLKPSYSVTKGFSFGAEYNEDGSYSFAVWSPRAQAVRLHFYTPDEEKTGTLTLNNRQGGVWYGRVEGLNPGELYALEALGEENPNQGLYFKEGRFLVDPYAKQLNKPFIYSDDAYFNHNESFIPKAVLQGPDLFDWQGTGRIFNSRSQAVVYEAHVKGRSCAAPT